MEKLKDPIFLEISWNRLISFVDEAGAALVRTAFSSIIREARDYACVLFDRTGRSLAQSTTSVPSFIGTLPHTMRHFQKALAKDGWAPGDVVVTNDPWIGSGHLQDISMIAPIFNRNGRLMAFSGVVAHPPDMGGKWSAECREIYEEGLQIPICKLVRGGEPNTDVFSFIRQNVRVPDQVIGDIHAMMAACAVAASRVNAFIDETGLESLDELASEIHRYSESAIRTKIQEIPDGEYRYDYEIDGYDHPLKIAASLIVDGTTISVDYTGSSKQVDRAINCPWVYTNAYTIYPLKCAISPDVPNNEGMMRPFHVSAPVGSLLNPEFPAAVGARNLTGHLLASAVFGALAQALPELELTNRVLADSASPRPHLVISGRDDTGRQFSSTIFVMGGMGARANKDGLHCIAFPSTTRNTPVEILETSTPIIVQKKVLRDGSGGRGRFRGGDGQIFEIRVRAKAGLNVAVFSDRSKFPPQGLNGGDPGAGAVVLLNGREVPSKGSHRLNKGDVLTVMSPGGGGFGHYEGNPKELAVRKSK